MLIYKNDVGMKLLNRGNRRLKHSKYACTYYEIEKITNRNHRNCHEIPKFTLHLNDMRQCRSVSQRKDVEVEGVKSFFPWRYFVRSSR